MAKKQTKLTKEVKEAKKLAKQVHKLANRVDELVKQDMLPEKEPELTAEEVFNFCDLFTSRVSANTSVNLNFDQACMKYVAAKNKHNEIINLIEEGKIHEAQLKDKMRVDPKELTDENFDEYYNIVSQLHRLLGQEIAILNYRAAAGVVFLDQIKRAFPSECIAN